MPLWSSWFERRRERSAWRAEMEQPFDWKIEDSRRLPIGSADDEVFEFITRWLADIARGKWNEALTRLLPPPTRTTHSGWTPAKLENVIQNYGVLRWPGERQRLHSPSDPWTAEGKLTPETARRLEPDPEEATGSVHDELPIAIYWFRERRSPDHLGYVTTQIPLDGKWSDLSADFDVEAVDDDSFGLRLGRLDVA
ncbi:MAG: hypothetical protein AAF517_21670 [Planctomycetota bacterium]